MQGRLAQHAQLAWARDAASRSAVEAAIVDIRAMSFHRNRVNLPPRFDVEEYCRVLIHTSFAAEIRPEQPERIAALLDAQRNTTIPMYDEYLRWLADKKICRRPWRLRRYEPPRMVVPPSIVGLLPSDEGARDGAMGQVRDAVRRLARVHHPESRSAQRYGDRADGARATMAVDLPLAESVSLRAIAAERRA